MIQRILAATALMALPLLSSCDEGQETPATQIYVLVDLSATWLRPELADRNGRLLAEIGQGISIATNDLETPISVQYRAIGANTLERDPLCDVLYRPRLAPTRTENDYEVTSRSDLKSYLADACPQKIASLNAEPLTEISTALASVANQPVAGAQVRDIIVISDFLEETAGPISLDADLTGFHVILLYRPVEQDQNSASVLRFRLESWAKALEERGASVDRLPDTGLHRATLADFLTKKQNI